MSRSCTRRRRAERGQAVVEFFLALLILVAGISAFYQALHFERDVFNKLLILRQRGFHESHISQDTTPRTTETFPVDFRTLQEVTPVPVMFQTVDVNTRFPSKNYRMQHGTMYADPLSLGGFGNNKWAIAAALTPEHDEDTKGYLVASVFNVTAIPYPCGGDYWGFTMSQSTVLDCGFIDFP